MSSSLSSSKRERGFSWDMLKHKRASSHVEGRISWFFGVVVGSLVFLSSCVGTWGTCWCFLSEVRSAFELRGALRDSSHIAAGMNRASSRVEAGTSGFLSDYDIDLGVSV